MEIPDTTRGDIENNEPIAIPGEVVHAQAFDDGNELYYLEDVDGNEIELKVWDAETDQYDIETGRWYLFERARGDVFQGDRKLVSNRGKMAVTALEGPPRDVDAGGAESASQLTDGGIVAVDIETISTVPETELDLDDSDHVELLCIGVGYAPGPGLPAESDVLFRDGTSPESEADLLERFCEYVDARDPEQLLLFEGEFDVKHLIGRAGRVETPTGIGGRVSTIFDEYGIVNLTPPGTLEDNVDEPVETHWDIYRHSLEPAEWRDDHPRYSGDLTDPRVTNKDISYFGERYLKLCDEGASGTEYRALRELIRHYTAADVEPLFELAT